MDRLVEYGDIYQLGKHRLMCGDSTLSDDVQKLMGGGVADMIFTDPPYALVGNSTGVNGVSDSMMIRPFFRALAAVMKESLKMMGHAYICCDFYTVSAIREVVDLAVKNLIVWQKSKGGGLGSYYTKTYELIWLFAKEPLKNISGNLSGIHARTINGEPNIWYCPVVQPKDRLHPAQKPLKIVEKAIANSSDKGEAVLDFFGGSGTTMIAAENLGRRCFMMEMNPEYCRTIIDRWEAKTGKTAERVTA